ncbi:multidrug transporter MatE [Bifidobacterium biavatii DSM 23969]|uniref:Multidrug transporter MatE n=2 Tax=Bifidobacterium biavatii TaxID=762212 RepID=A0A087A0E7_9BIFI|nr:multidrug transporter MatE [Bifidobacterium biavatii DSM 23969]
MDDDEYSCKKERDDRMTRDTTMDTGAADDRLTLRMFISQLRPLALPIAFQQFVLVLSNACDVFMLASADQNALSAVSLAAQFQFVFDLFLLAFTIGASTLIAQYWGRGDAGAVGRVISFVMGYTVVLSVMFVLLAAAIPMMLMRVTTNDPLLIDLGAQYLSAGAPAFLLIGISQINLCLFKNTGRASTGTLISVAGVFVHIMASAMFIFGLLGLPRLGVMGAAISTLISRGVECAWSMIVATSDARRRRAMPSVHWRYMRQPDHALMRDYWRYTLPVLGNEIAWGGGFATYTIILGHLGSAAVAANSVANIVKDLLVCFTAGLGSGGGILVGGMMGAGMLDRARKAGGWLVRSAFVAGVAIGVVILAIRPLVLHWSQLDARANAYLSPMLIVCAYYVIGKAVNSTTVGGLFPAGGDARFGLICDVVTIWLIVVPLGLCAAFVWHWPVMAVYVLLSADEFIKMPAVFAHYRTYRWLNNVTHDEPQ